MTRVRKGMKANAVLSQDRLRTVPEAEDVDGAEPEAERDLRDMEPLVLMH